MVRITEDLVRKRSEHNDCEIFSLEELSLHQQDIDKIEHLDRWCRDLKILYLQSNLIEKIENVGRLKKVEYINFALNNIEKIENLQGCESLKKLDLTVNFVGELTSVESLRSNFFLEEIYMTGNPCVNFEGYREYVIATLPQLRWLDGKEIEKSERIIACQNHTQLKARILEQQKEYLQKREVEKKQAATKKSTAEDEQDKNGEDQKEFWETECDFTPESRKEIHEKIRENQKSKHKPMFEKKTYKRQRRYFNDNGDPMNVNEGGIDFTLTETEDDSAYILDVACYKHLDTSLLDVDTQPKYVRVTIKEKVLQLVLYEEIRTDKCTAKRSQATGHLVVTLPKLNSPPASKPKNQADNSSENIASQKANSKRKENEKLEYKPTKSLHESLAEITKENSLSKSNMKIPLTSASKKKIEEPSNSEDFIDDPNVPPLI